MILWFHPNKVWCFVYVFIECMTHHAQVELSNGLALDRRSFSGKEHAHIDTLESRRLSISREQFLRMPLHCRNNFVGNRGARISINANQSLMWIYLLMNFRAKVIKNLSHLVSFFVSSYSLAIFVGKVLFVCGFASFVATCNLYAFSENSFQKMRWFLARK